MCDVCADGVNRTRARRLQGMHATACGQLYQQQTQQTQLPHPSQHHRRSLSSALSETFLELITRPSARRHKYKLCRKKLCASRDVRAAFLVNVYCKRVELAAQGCGL